MKTNGRLFTFGCSLTCYKWPTWADILGREYAYFENWANCGVGNQYIFNSLVEAVITRQISSGDTVIVMWTNFSRWDYYQDGGWRTSMFYRDSKDSDWQTNEKLLDMMLDIRGVYLRDLALLYAAHSLLDHIGCDNKIFSVVDINNIGFGMHDTVDPDVGDLLDNYQSTLKRIRTSVHRAVFDLDWHNRPIFETTPRKDLHPSPAEHLEYLDKVLPEIKISQYTRDWVSQADMLVQQHPEIDGIIDPKANHYAIPDWRPVTMERW